MIESNKTHSKNGKTRIQYKMRMIMGTNPFNAKILGIFVLYLTIVMLMENKETAKPPKAIMETRPCNIPGGPCLSKLKIPTNNIPILPATPIIVLDVVIRKLMNILRVLIVLNV